MNVRNRFGIAIATVALGVVGTFGLTACGLGTGAAAAATTSLSPEASALTALGFSNNDVTTADGSDSGNASPDATASNAPNAQNGQNGNHKRPAWRRLLIRRGLAKHVEHGEITVSTKDGEKTIVVQRGVITAISDTSITVKCADGFTMTWTIGNPIHVIEHRTTVQPKDLVAGDTIGIAGLQDGSTDTAKLIVVPNASQSTSGS